MQQLLARSWYSYLFKFYRIASLITVALKWSYRNILISTVFLQCYAHLSKGPLGPKADRASFPKAERWELHGVGPFILVQFGFLSIHFVIPTCTLASAPKEEVKAAPVCLPPTPTPMPLVPITLQSWPVLSAPSLTTALTELKFRQAGQ